MEIKDEWTHGSTPTIIKIMINLLLTVLAIFLVGMLIPQFLVRSIIGPVFRIFVVPGVIVHESSHALACLLTGAQIQNIRFFKREGGEVSHTPPSIPLLGPLLITSAPLIIGFLVLIFLAGKVLGDVSHLRVGHDIGQFPDFLMQVVKSVHWRIITSWVWLYLIFAIGSTMTPSIQDLKNSALPIGLLIAAAVIILRNPAWHASADKLAIVILPALTAALFILLVLAFFSLIIYLISGVFGINR